MLIIAVPGLLEYRRLYRGQKWPQLDLTGVPIQQPKSVGGSATLKHDTEARKEHGVTS